MAAEHRQRAQAVREVDRRRGRRRAAAPAGRTRAGRSGMARPASSVAHERAQDELRVDHADRGEGGRCARRPRRSRRGAVGQPLARGAVGERHRQAEERLGQAGVRDRDRGGQQEEHGEPAQQRPARSPPPAPPRPAAARRARLSRRQVQTARTSVRKPDEAWPPCGGRARRRRRPPWAASACRRRAASRAPPGPTPCWSPARR